MKFLFDIGGTNTRFAFSKDGKTLDATTIIQTPKTFNEAIASFKKAINGIAITASAGGIAGPLDEKKEKLVNAPNLKDWIGKPLVREISKLTGSAVFLENDSSLAGLGEATSGAGKGKKIVAYLTVSTGVGGTRIVDGKIDSNTYGFEPGHQIIREDGRKCLCNNAFGHLEGYVSGSAFKMQYGKDAFLVQDPEVWEKAAKDVAIGLNNTIVYWSPEVVVLGGSMITKKPGIPLNKVQYHLQNTLHIFPKLPKLVKAKLGDLGGLYGALAFLQQKTS